LPFGSIPNRKATYELETGLGVSYEYRDHEKLSISITEIFDQDNVSVRFQL